MFVSDPAAPLVALARSEFEMQAAQNNNYDLIGLGVATFALALGGIDVALKGDLGQLWFLPWVPIVAAIVLSIGALDRRDVVGLDVRKMADHHAGGGVDWMSMVDKNQIADGVSPEAERVLPEHLPEFDPRVSQVVMTTGFFHVPLLDD
jgi:hypothetical protein